MPITFKQLNDVSGTQWQELLKAAPKTKDGHTRMESEVYSQAADDFDKYRFTLDRAHNIVATPKKGFAGSFASLVRNGGSTLPLTKQQLFAEVTEDLRRQFGGLADQLITSGRLDKRKAVTPAQIQSIGMNIQSLRQETKQILVLMRPPQGGDLLSGTDPGATLEQLSTHYDALLPLQKELAREKLFDEVTNRVEFKNGAMRVTDLRPILDNIAKIVQGDPRVLRRRARQFAPQGNEQ
jgi:hypothetical protein